MRFIPTDYPNEDEKQIHRRLENWANWCRGRWVQGRCASAEGGYNTPWRQWHYPVLLSSVDILDAEEINSVVVRLPVLHRDLIRFHYFFKYAPLTICRKLALRHICFQDMMRHSRLMVRNLLTKQKSKTKVPTHNSIPSSAEEESGPEGPFCLLRIATA